MHHSTQYPYQVSFCNIGNDISIAYGKMGSGSKTILFIHGLANYGPVWYQNMLDLSKEYSCIAIDLPGNGQSTRGDYPYTMFFYAECVARFIEKLKLQYVTLVGHSMGGHISIIAALRYPHLLEKLVLVAPSGFEHFTETERVVFKQMLSFGKLIISDKLSLKAALQSSFYNANNTWVQKHLKTLYQFMDDFDTQQWQKMVEANIYAMIDEQVSMFLPHLELPTLVFFGKQDALIPIRAIHLFTSTEALAKTAADKIPNCKLVLFDYCGHLVQVEKAQQFNLRVKQFVEN